MAASAEHYHCSPYGVAASSDNLGGKNAPVPRARNDYWRAHSPTSYPPYILSNWSINAVAPGSWAYEQHGMHKEVSEYGSSSQHNLLKSESLLCF